MAFNDLVDEIAELLGSTKEEIVDKIAQFYTDLNIDGRFLNVGGNTWGIKAWYSVDQFEDDIVPTVKRKKKKAKILDDEFDDEFDELDDEDLDLYDEDLLDDDLEEDLDDVDDEFDEDDDLLIDDEFDDEELDLDEDIDEED